MRITLLTILLTILTLTTSAEEITTGNLVTNGNFETGNANNWTTSGDVQVLNDCCELNGVTSTKDLEANSEFRIKYPRGELGQSSGEAELFMLVEHMAGLIESMDEELKGMRNNKINIDFLKEQVSKLQEDVEKLIRNGNGH